ncbi:hypothetical protein ACFL35_12200 [Candidatus Riflebacteria bacterium]
MKENQEQQLHKDKLFSLIQNEDVENLDYQELRQLINKESGICDFCPERIFQVDPRNNDRIVYNNRRAKRPHDNRPAAVEGQKVLEMKKCVICEGNTTGIIDCTSLSKGFTFINKNLFPILYPFPVDLEQNFEPVKATSKPGGHDSYGLHLLQWTSSLHDYDWQNMEKGDRKIVLNRLACLEKSLLFHCKGNMPDNNWCGEEQGGAGFVSIIKNYGSLVGGSLEHGHQQIAFSNVMPRKFLDNLKFEREHGEKYTDFILKQNPTAYLDYGSAVLLVPYFMRRPYDMQLVLKDTGKSHLFQLSEKEIADIAEGWHDAIRAILYIMPAIGRETAYNVTTHNGPGAGLYFEFLPYTQETGGYEHLGLILCQAVPGDVANNLREVLNGRS